MKYLFPIILLASGCSVMDSKKSSIVRFSENPQMPVVDSRKFQRLNRAELEKQSDVNEEAGSFWRGEGQGAYLFAQNKVRQQGDLLNVRLEGAGQKQIDQKVSVLKDLIQKLEAAQAAQNAASQASSDPASGEEARKPAAVEKPVEKPAEGSSVAESVQYIPTRITEILQNGTYRVKGFQPFMIGAREYKVIVSGLIRAEDFNEDGVVSSKLLEAQYDVVGLKRIM